MSDQVHSDASKQHYGTVVALDGDRAVVRFARGSMCKHCGACLAIGEKEMELHVKNTENAAVGDAVIVELAPKSIVSASMLAYVFPLLALLLGIWSGLSVFGELGGILLGLVCCLLAYGVLRCLDRRFAKKQTFAPRMSACIKNTKEENQ